jgi:cytoskeletal protein RodZ
MKQINPINRFFTGLWMLVFLLGIFCILPSQSMAQSKNASVKTDKKEVSQRGVQPKKSKQQSLSNKQAPAKKAQPANASKQSSEVNNARQGSNGNKNLSTAADKKEKEPKEARTQKNNQANNKAQKGNQVSLSNKAPESTSTNPSSASKSNAMSYAEMVKADWVIKREKTKNHLLSQGLSKEEVEKKLQEMDKNVEALTK